MLIKVFFFLVYRSETTRAIRREQEDQKVASLSFVSDGWWFGREAEETGHGREQWLVVKDVG